MNDRTTYFQSIPGTKGFNQIVALPVDMIKKDDGDISVKPNPGEGENKPSTGGDGTGTGTEGETKPELDTYVSGIQDYEIKVGEDIDTSSISYNAEHISSVDSVTTGELPEQNVLFKTSLIKEIVALYPNNNVVIGGTTEKNPFISLFIK